MVDNQVELMQGDLADLGALLNIVSTDEHVPEIEQDNRMIKEGVQCIYNTLPFKYLLPVFAIEMVYAFVFLCNIVALHGDISETQSPLEIVLNQTVNFNAQCKFECGLRTNTQIP
jgi:hypothetical protein